MTKKNGGTKLAILPLTPGLWPAFDDLFAKWRASNGCWCIHWRIGGAYRGKRSENKEALREIVERGSPRACSPSTAIWRWAVVRSRHAMHYLGLIACGGSGLWTICPSGRSPVSLCAGTIADEGSCLSLSLEP